MDFCNVCFCRHGVCLPGCVSGSGAGNGGMDSSSPPPRPGRNRNGTLAPSTELGAALRAGLRALGSNRGGETIAAGPDWMAVRNEVQP